MNLAIFCGGKSFEHEISILSTIQIYKGIQKNHYDNIYVLYITKENDIYWIKDINPKNFLNLKKERAIDLIKRGFLYKRKKYTIDFSLIIMHGNYGEDGRINALLDFFNIPYANNSINSSYCCLDKAIMKEKFKSLNIPTMDYFVIKSSEQIECKFDLPVIIKAAKLGSSIGIEVCNNHEDFQKKVEKLLLYDDTVVVEPYIENFEEYNIALKTDIDKGIIFSNIEKVQKTDSILSFENKYMNQATKVLNPEIDEKIKSEIMKISKKAYEEFDLSYIVRFDFIVKDKKVYLNEINNIPGSLSFYLFNESIESHIYSLIKYSMFNNKENKLNFAILNDNTLLNLTSKK